MRLHALLTVATLAFALHVPLALAGHSTAGLVSGNFVVPCIRIPTGGGVTFVVAGLGEHDIRSAFDSGECFQARDDLGRAMRAGDQYRVELHYMAARLFRAVDDEMRDCAGAIDWTRSSGDHAYLVYECDVHRSFRGAIVVDAS